MTVSSMVAKPRTYIIGDIHGCLSELKRLIKTLEQKEQLGRNDRLIFVGDYIDEGYDSFGVVDYLIQLQERYPCIFLMGDHELYFLDFLNNPEGERFDKWMNRGGKSTLISYYRALKPEEAIKFDFDEIPVSELRLLQEVDIPIAHLNFFHSLKSYLYLKKTSAHYFISHGQIPASFRDIKQVMAHIKTADSFSCKLFWGRVRYASMFKSKGMVFVSGHTVQQSVQDMGDVVLLDTGCVYGGMLSAFCVENHQTYQVVGPKPIK